jgi:hypothetical protein
VEVGSNTSLVAQRIVGGDEEETGAWGYTRATLFLIRGPGLQVVGFSNLKQ